VPQTANPAIESGESRGAQQPGDASNSTITEAQPSATVQKRESAGAPPKAETAESVDGGTAKTRNAPSTGDTRPRAVAPQRTKEQAERDASATQRLIERELGDAARAGSGSSSPPRP